MPFQKGQKKTGGREVGTANKTSSQMRNHINSFLEKYFDSDSANNFENDFNSLEPDKRILFCEKLLAYAMPKFQNIEAEQPKQDAAMTKIVEHLLLLNK
jgi:hypothetical protein